MLCALFARSQSKNCRLPPASYLRIWILPVVALGEGRGVDYVGSAEKGQHLLLDTAEVFKEKHYIPQTRAKIRSANQTSVII